MTTRECSSHKATTTGNNLKDNTLGNAHPGNDRIPNWSTQKPLKFSTEPVSSNTIRSLALKGTFGTSLGQTNFIRFWHVPHRNRGNRSHIRGATFQPKQTKPCPTGRTRGCDRSCTQDEIAYQMADFRPIFDGLPTVISSSNFTDIN